jgi:hypothetical protein
MISMQYGKAFGFMTDEAGWTGKYLIAAFSLLVPIVGPFLLLGYGYEITRRVIAGESPVLPEWSDFGDYLKKGIAAAAIWAIYSLPFILLSGCLNTPAYVLLRASDNYQQLAGELLALCGGCLALVLLLALNLLGPAALAHSAARGSLGAAFQLGDVVHIVRTKPAVYLMAALLLGLLNLALLPIGFMLCVIGMFPVLAFGSITAAHLHGQAYRVAASEAGLFTVPLSPAPSSSQ